VIFLDGIWGRKFPTSAESAESGELPLEFFGVWQIHAAIFKNEPKLQFPKIATKKRVKNGICYTCHHLIASVDLDF
jgi:hypothetical protein